MFFTEELLARRDSGFGLLWLAATLGPKSSFKKLPKRSVITADISQLCRLIVNPPEPLALRLSSNLMIGVARVYRVKQEILLTDVTSCFNTLKRAVQDLQTADLQMAQPTVRMDAVTIPADPTAAFALEFDHLLATWDERVNQHQDILEDDTSDEEYNPTKRPLAKKRQRGIQSVSAVERGRAEMHTLEENHELFLSAPLDGSFSGGYDGVGPPSSLPGLGLRDDFLDGIDIGDELAQELGEGWGGPSSAQAAGSIGSDQWNTQGVREPELVREREQDDLTFTLDFDNELAEDVLMEIGPVQDPEVVPGATEGEGLGRDPIIVPLSPLAPVLETPEQEAERAQRKTKRVRLLLDSRTELTNEELQRARTFYMEEQAAIRREIAQKKADKESERMLDEMVRGVPRGLHAPILIDFWLENFRLQVEARSGQLHIESDGQPPKKRRRVEGGSNTPDRARRNHEVYHRGVAPEPSVEDGFDPFEVNAHEIVPEVDDYVLPSAQSDVHAGPLSVLRSSEEPGQGRRASRPASLLGSQFNFEPLQVHPSDTQRSSLFPWDNAGISSPGVGAAFDFFPGSASHRGAGGSSLDGGRSSARNIGVSPGLVFRHGRMSVEPFEFEVPEDGPQNHDRETQQSDLSVVALERHSQNFYEYAKIQLKTFSTPTDSLTFDNLVPPETSTPHVASAAFYHCLVLATKELFHVKQDDAYGTIHVMVK